MVSQQCQDVSPKNETVDTHFIMKGITDDQRWKTPIFLLVLQIYLITLGGNLTIFLLVCLDPHLHTPMYFFLGNLSIIDMTSSTVTLHKILSSFLTGVNKVSFVGCMLQFYLFASLTGDELLILTAMSYDRYVAVCDPLRYHIVMNYRRCILMATVSWLSGFIEILPHVIRLWNLSYPKTRVINHFFCDILPLLNMSCTDTFISYLMIFITGFFHMSIAFFLTFIPYIFIISDILRITSSIGRRKAFYTCSSHFTVVVLLYMTLVCQYLIPTTKNDLDFSKLFSLFNTAAVPMLNPLIYSLKNKDVKSAMRRRLKCS